MVHNGGHLPFEGDITELLMAGQPNTVTAAVNNTLNDHTLPPGYITYYNDDPRYSSYDIVDRNLFFNNILSFCYYHNFDF